MHVILWKWNGRFATGKGKDNDAKTSNFSSAPYRFLCTRSTAVSRIACRPFVDRLSTEGHSLSVSECLPYFVILTLVGCDRSMMPPRLFLITPSSMHVRWLYISWWCRWHLRIKDSGGLRVEVYFDNNAPLCCTSHMSSPFKPDKTRMSTWSQQFYRLSSGPCVRAIRSISLLLLASTTIRVIKQHRTAVVSIVRC